MTLSNVACGDYCGPDHKELARPLAEVADASDGSCPSLCAFYPETVRPSCAIDAGPVGHDATYVYCRWDYTACPR
jgi:hypothetical protein